MQSCNFSFGRTSGHASVQFVFRLHSLVPKIPYFGLKIGHFSGLICNSVTSLHNSSHFFLIVSSSTWAGMLLQLLLKGGMKPHISPVITKTNSNETIEACVCGGNLTPAFVLQITDHPSRLYRNKPAQTKTTGPDFNHRCWNRKVKLPGILLKDFQWSGSAAGPAPHCLQIC